MICYDEMHNHALLGDNQDTDVMPFPIKPKSHSHFQTPLFSNFIVI